MLTKPKRTARFYYLKLIRLRGEPRYLARGVALGVFIGITPTIPLHTILILALAFTLRTSKISALLSSWVVSNPLTIPAQYYFSWWVGKLLFPGNLSWHRINSVLQKIEAGGDFMSTFHHIAALGTKAIAAMLAGGCLVAIPFTMAGYFISLNIFQKIEARRQKRREAGNQNVQPS
ncbi:MAG: DUF2062 domain-containing protein [Desulfobulbaceae bacterium]|nr:DUF2062 domain-containing protein [Desulfobulbaceae bacterium]